MPDEQGSSYAGATDSEKNKLLDRFEKEIKRCTKNWEQPFEEIRRARRLLEGEIPDNVPRASEGVGLVDARGNELDPTGMLSKKKVRANLLLATNESMLPLIYARNPDVSVRPAEKVGSEGEVYTHLKRWSETLEIVVSNQLNTSGLKTQAKKMVRSIQAAKVGWLKISYQREFKADPQILNRMNDVQENLAEIEGRIASLSDDDPTLEQEELQAAELRQLIQGLEETPEVIVADGVVIDHIPTDNMRIDPNVSLLEDYTKAAWMAHYDELTVDTYRHRFNISEEAMRGVKIFRKRPGQETADSRAYTSGSTHGSGDTEVEMVRLWELWHRVDNTIYTFAEGAMDFAREPWVPQGLGQRWYPFWMVGFHWIDGSAWPQSPVDLLEGLQQEYNDTREQKNEHRRANVPHYMAAGGDIEPKDVTSFTVAGAREVVIIDTGGRPIKDIIAPSPQIPLNPQMYTTDETRSDMQWVSGVQDAARGGVVKAKTLGEAEIAENHLASRASNFQDELEEALTEISVYVAQMVLQKMDKRTVIKIAGDNAVWPELARTDVFELFDVQVRAGSTGKPDRRAEQEQWTAILPQLVELIGQIIIMRQQGMPDQLNPLVKILEETLKRFDERMDLEQILPPQEQAPQQQIPMGQPGQGGNGQQIPPELVPGAGGVNPQQPTQ